MKYKRLGSTGLKISSVCLGSNNFGEQVDQENSIKIIRKAIDLGVNIIDTANQYTKGKSEEVIGKAVGDYREDVVLATKVGWELHPGPGRSGLSRRNLLSEIKRSLERLQTDYIDIYYLHRPDPETPLEESLRTMNDFVRQGRVRYAACSNFTAWQIAKANGICEALGLEKLVAVQPRYNLLQRDIEQDLLPYCQEEGLGVLTYSPLMGGFLTGKYDRNTLPPMDSRAKYNARYWQRVNDEANFVVLERIRSVAKSAGIPLSQLALAWIMKNPAVTAPIVGGSKPEHVEQACQALEIDISEENRRKLDEATTPSQ
jgi:aryl-alcohol dehydrogenase-like predicted oxidoreductase